MNKIKFFSVLFLTIAGTSAIFAQSRVALHHEGQVTIFGGGAPFTDAYNAAADGDTIYLHGGSFAPPAVIDKGIAIYGAGHYPDSTAVTLPTSITGNVAINENADNLRFEGILFTGNITFNNNQKVDNVVISRCRINGALTYNHTNNMATPCENHLISQCVIIGGMNFNNLQGGTITNCILQSRINNGNNLNIVNNIFLWYHGSYCDYDAGTIISVNNSIIANNIHLNRFLCTGYPFVYGGSGNTLLNNLTPAGNNSASYGGHSCSDNYTFTVVDDIFVDAANNTFDYTDDYHLQNPETYIGTDGTQVGIYGGALGYKPGAVPSNPHFSSATIAPTTDGDGKLNVNIKVIAQ